MNALLAKEIRLILPAFWAALAVATMPTWWLQANVTDVDGTTAYLFPLTLGVMLLAVASFGREFGLQTFPLLLAQPLERRRIWWTKIAVLGGALAVVFALWFLTSLLSIKTSLGLTVWWNALPTAGIVVLATASGGLWATLLLRQMMAAFWITWFAPLVITIILVESGAAEGLLAVLVVYSAAGIGYARWLFIQAQEVGWTGGGTVVLPGWRFQTTSAPSQARAYHPLRAIFWKELQLLQVGLLGMAALFLLHLGVPGLWKLGPEVLGKTGRVLMETFGWLWLLPPLLIGSLSVADERKLGTFEGQLCQPLSRRTQYVVKLLLVLLVGGLLSGLLLWAAEAVGTALDAPSSFAATKLLLAGFSYTELWVLFFCFSLAGFYGSTLTRGILQAMPTALLVLLGVVMFRVFLTSPPKALGWWEGNLVHYFAWPILTVMLLWLGYSNFRRLSEGRQMWRRNLYCLAATLLLISCLTAAVYHRIWDLVLPFEPAHGPPQLAESKSVQFFQSYDAGIAARLPDGRLWVSRGVLTPSRKWVIDTVWQKGQHLVDDTNWMDIAVTPREIVGIRSDGTLWASAQPLKISEWRSNRSQTSESAFKNLVQVGTASNWQQINAVNLAIIFLLRKDGTLWQWKLRDLDNLLEGPGFTTFEPQRQGTDSDWAKIDGGGIGLGFYAWKGNGQGWALYPGVNGPPKGPRIALEPGGLIAERFPLLDHTQWRCIVPFWGSMLGVSDDGSLWSWSAIPPYRKEDKRQIGRNTNWAGVMAAYPGIVALKTDGSLWHYIPAQLASWHRSPELDLYSGKRLSRFTDWIALEGMHALAADGSLWTWGYDFNPLLAPKIKPAKVGNIFSP